MKILHSQVMSGIAGSESVLRSLLPALVTRGHEIHFLCIHPVSSEAVCRDYCDALEAEGVRTHRAPYRSGPNLATLRALDRLVGSGGFDLVHSHLLKTDCLFAAARALWGRTYRLVSTKHGYQESFTAKHGFNGKARTRDSYWWAARAAETQMTASSAVSTGVADLFCDLGITEPERMHLTHLGFDYAPPQPAPPDLRVGTPQLCQVGRLVEYKGHAFAIDAVARLKDEFPHIALVFVGSGPYEAHLRQLAESAGVAAQVMFVGRQSRPTDYVRASDVALVPSRAEGFGLVILEAMSAMRPVVAFDVPSPNEILQHGHTGMLVPPYSGEGYAAAIRQLLRSPEERDKLAREARYELLSAFSLTAMTDGFERFYASALATRPRPSWRAASGERAAT